MKGPKYSQESPSASYLHYFNGRPYADSLCYLTIAQRAKEGRLFSYDSKKWRDFLVKIYKARDLLRDSDIQVKLLNRTEASEYMDHYFAMSSKDHTVSAMSAKVDDETVSTGDKRRKVYSLVGMDCAMLPLLICPCTDIEVNNAEMPVNPVSVVDSIPSAETVVCNQITFLLSQKRELALLDKKKNRHASTLDPSNQMAVEGIEQVRDVIARESKLLVYTRFNMVVGVPADTDLQKCMNHLENAFGHMDIHISKCVYNQLELFISSFPGNCYSLNEEYSHFPTPSDATVCLMHKERV